jgi:hypothetical protein
VEIGSIPQHHMNVWSNASANELTSQNRSFFCGDCVQNARTDNYVHRDWNVNTDAIFVLAAWDLREQMTQADIEIILERATERYSG